ncbi:MarR family transcriptional regulator [Microbacterium thalassium]|uniref:MarR family transcriptional regulator n=1 Tax=Microbacterium TaxID=33882 RepID=UPI00146A5F7F|nr:MarR family transcriptional regulator [Microbacterium thalassium]
MAEWTFLTRHAHVLLAVAEDNDATLERIADVVGISTRSAVTILNDLESAGYLERHKRGRRNHYVLHPDRSCAGLDNLPGISDSKQTGLRRSGFRG